MSNLYSHYRNPLKPKSDHIKLSLSSRVSKLLRVKAKVSTTAYEALYDLVRLSDLRPTCSPSHLLGCNHIDLCAVLNMLWPQGL